MSRDDVAVLEWRREPGNGGMCWRSEAGTAYSAEMPPSSAPLTWEEVRGLPNDTDVTVVWGGGNGPCHYVWRDGRVWFRERDGRLTGGATLGGLVGRNPWQNKVWRGGAK